MRAVKILQLAGMVGGATSCGHDRKKVLRCESGGSVSSDPPLFLFSPFSASAAAGAPSAPVPFAPAPSAIFCGRLAGLFCDFVGECIKHCDSF